MQDDGAQLVAMVGSHWTFSLGCLMRWELLHAEVAAGEAREVAFACFSFAALALIIIVLLWGLLLLLMVRVLCALLKRFSHMPTPVPTGVGGTGYRRDDILHRSFVRWVRTYMRAHACRFTSGVSRRLQAWTSKRSFTHCTRKCTTAVESDLDGSTLLNFCSEFLGMNI